MVVIPKEMHKRTCKIIPQMQSYMYVADYKYMYILESNKLMYIFLNVLFNHRKKFLDRESVNRSESKRMDRMWISVVTLRVVWTVLGQLGYIHPDEFFQSSEIVGGRAEHFTITK